MTITASHVGDELVRSAASAVRRSPAHHSCIGSRFRSWPLAPQANSLPAADVRVAAGTKTHQFTFHKKGDRR